MSTYPTQGSSPWDDSLKAYIDDQDELKADETDLAAHTGNTSNPHSTTKAQVGLSNVDNTADASKPVSTAQATAIAVVQSDVDAHEANTSNPHSVTKTQVGLANVDNTADSAKPVSTAQATAIATVQSDVDAHEADTANPHAVTKTQVGLSNVNNTSDASKPVSTAQQTALDAKMDDVAPGASGNVLTSNGSDWTSAAPAGGGGGSPSTTTSLEGNGTSVVDITIDPTAYRGYRVDFYVDIHAEDDSVGASYLFLAFDSDTTTAHYVWETRGAYGTTNVVDNETNQGISSSIPISSISGSGNHFEGSFTVTTPIADTAPGSSSQAKAMVRGSSITIGNTLSNTIYGTDFYGFWKQGNAPTNLKFRTSPFGGSHPITGGYITITPLTA